MKRQLFTTTALVTAGVLASTVAQAEEGIKLGLGGYMNNYFGGGDVDSDGNDFNETSLWSDGEVFFTGDQVLSSGTRSNCARCQAIASPSRSRSVARNSLSQFLAADFNEVTTRFLPGMTS